MNLVWQWGRYGAGPKMAAMLADGFASAGPVALSLSAGAELLAGDAPPACALPVETYRSAPGFAWRLARGISRPGALTHRIASLAPTLAVCAMPGPLDAVMLASLRRLSVPAAVIVHDADAHPGDGLPLQMTLQRRTLRGADVLVALSGHVADRLRAQGFAQPILRTQLPPFVFGPPPPPPGAHGGPLRLLSFGRLLPYKGLDLLAEAMRRMRGLPIALRIVGQGPDSFALSALATMPGVTVENRWVAEQELGSLMAWADALVLTYREASQSGVASAALAAGRWVVSTDVGGLREQLAGEPLARLCAPAPDAIADAIRSLLDNPPLDLPRPDPAAAWRDVARGLLEDIAAVLPARARVRA